MTEATSSGIAHSTYRLVPGEGGLRRDVTVPSTSTRRSSERDQLSCHCPNVTVLVTPTRALTCGRADDLAR